MPNGEHPFQTDERTEALVVLINDLAAQAAAAAAQKPHNNLNDLRSRLQQYCAPNWMGRAFATEGAHQFATTHEVAVKRWEYWQYLRGLYVDWKMANDDDFWTTMHQGVDEPLPEPDNPFPYE